MSTLEAMALGKPVISIDVVPFVKDNFNSLVFKPKDFTTLANHIDKLLSNEKLKEPLSKNAHETAKELSIDSMCKEYKNLIERFKAENV
jgi:N-acetylgalactosamine-N,N'-diacetylbacillosaminyl-diphospho-undecaprenol 4-alpha-N-acetylgalactosaminyltransferase